MQLSPGTIVLLARSGDEQAIDILRNVENDTRKTLTEVKFFFQKGPGVFLGGEPSHTGKKTIMGMRAITPELEAELLANRNRS
jgi:N-acetylglucosamine kinase-like BadF-type ATPase